MTRTHWLSYLKPSALKLYFFATYRVCYVQSFKDPMLFLIDVCPMGASRPILQRSIVSICSPGEQHPAWQKQPRRDGSTLVWRKWFICETINLLNILSNIHVNSHLLPWTKCSKFFKKGTVYYIRIWRKGNKPWHGFNMNITQYFKHIDSLTSMVDLWCLIAVCKKGFKINHFRHTRVFPSRLGCCCHARVLFSGAAAGPYSHDSHVKKR